MESHVCVGVGVVAARLGADAFLPSFGPLGSQMPKLYKLKLCQKVGQNSKFFDKIVELNGPFGSQITS